MFFVYKIYRRTTSKIGYMNKSKMFIYIVALGLMGFLCGGFLGFLVRPSFFKGMSGEKPSFKDVMTRGSYYPSLFDDVRSPYKSTAEDAFNIMVGGALLGLIAGVISGAGFFHKKDREHDINEGTIILSENPKEKAQAEAKIKKTWVAKKCPNCQYSGKFILTGKNPEWFTSAESIPGLLLLLYAFWSKHHDGTFFWQNQFFWLEPQIVFILGIALIISIVDCLFMLPKIYECPECHFPQNKSRIGNIVIIIWSILTISLWLIGENSRGNF